MPSNNSVRIGPSSAAHAAQLAKGATLVQSDSVKSSGRQKVTYKFHSIPALAGAPKDPVRPAPAFGNYLKF